MSQVQTTQGVVEGIVEHGIEVFKGVPFAQAARFEPPRPPERWEGVRDATQYGPICPQGMPGTQPRQGQQPRQGRQGRAGLADAQTQSEDCLRLNVWTPATQGSRPVMVYVHGGGFSGGSGSSPMYNGGRLAKRGDVVVVTINYRLGILGFLYAPEIESVNVGLRDQVAALEWVRDNIAAFGGDPGNVTVFGESAGGKSVELLLAMPSAKGLYVRAIAQSTYDTAMDPAVFSWRKERLAREAGGLDALRSMPVSELLALNGRLMRAGMRRGDAEEPREREPAGAPALGSGTGAGGPVVDGDVIPAHPVGATDPVPFVVGTTLDELSGFGAGTPQQDLDEEGLRRRLQATGVDADEALNAYRQTRGSETSLARVWAAVQVDRTFRQHSIRLAEAHSKRQPQTYMYLFTGAGGPRGAVHAMELPYVFGMTPMGMGGEGGPPAAAELGRAMQGAWLAFARGDEPWPPYEGEGRRTQVFGETCQTREAPLEAERLLWASQ